jgi:hypothetical protein
VGDEDDVLATERLESVDDRRRARRDVIDAADVRIGDESVADEFAGWPRRR